MVKRFLLMFLWTTITVFAGQPRWMRLATLPTAVTGHSAVMVHTGDVVVVGGHAASGIPQGQTVVIRGATGSVVPALNTLPTPRTRFALVEVRATDGTSRCYAIGGYTGTGGNYVSNASVDVLRYVAGQNNWQWEHVGDLPVAVGDCRAVADGRGGIIVTGGVLQLSGALGNGAKQTGSTRITITTGRIDRLGDAVTARAEHGAYRTLDQTGQPLVLIAGGEATRPTTSTELLVNATWDARANPPRMYRSQALGVSDRAEIARVFGGRDAAGIALSSCEWYDVKSGWRAAPTMSDARAQHDGALVAGPVDTASAYAIVGGNGKSGDLATCEIFSLPRTTDPNGTWSPMPSMIEPGRERRIAMTSSNVPVVAGGDNSGTMLSGIEIYEPLRAADVEFKQTEVGAVSDSMSIIIENTWLLPISVRRVAISGTAEFSVGVDTTVIIIPSGERRLIRTWFRPIRPGTRTADVVLECGAFADTVHLRGEGVASTLSVLTDAISIGDVAVRTSQRVCTTLLRNTGTDTATVDSLIIDPPSAYRIVSPIGRSRIAPGDSLVVCIEFEPQQRGVAPAVLTTFVGARRLPVAVSGRGIRTMVLATSSGVCDTVVAVKGSVIPLYITASNPADRPVTIRSIRFLGGTVGVFSAGSVPLPTTIAPGASQQLEILFTMQREAVERVTVDLDNDGDTAARADLCIVPRSRTVRSVTDSIFVGDLCPGDSVERDVVFENASTVDTITITDLDVVGDLGYAILQNVQATLPPRAQVRGRVLLRATQSGTISASVRALGSFGTVDVPISGRVVEYVQTTMQNILAQAGDVIDIPLTITSASSLPATFTMNFRYPGQLLAPRSITSTTPGIDAAQTTIAVNGSGVTGVRVSTTTPIPSAAFRLRCDVLRGNDVQGEMRFTQGGSSPVCVLSSIDTLVVRTDCVNSGGLVRPTSSVAMMVTPSPVRETATIAMMNLGSAAYVMEVVDMHGLVVARYMIDQPHSTFDVRAIDCTMLSNGLYSILLQRNGTTLTSYPLMVIR
ncbi:MAG: hypothetical protein JSS89_00965 [Bacteroidetes bacterium]|nr:hypothetical protein [Bacteroidota bacterium]